MVDLIKEAFAKAKQDISSLQKQIDSLKDEILSLKELIQTGSVNVIKQPKNEQNSFQNPSNNIQNQQTDNNQNPTLKQIPLAKPNQYSLKSQYIISSTGNDGVPTDRQTNQQTDNTILNEPSNTLQKETKIQLISQKSEKKDKISQLEKVSEMLNSLDSIKKELRHQFKQLTSQEMAVFSCIYDLESQGFIVDYSLISQKMSLSESSIRDYIQKIIKKGIPIVKTKENNKKVLLKIDENLKKIASLQTLLTLREI